MVDEEESDGGMSYVYRRTEDIQRTPYVPYRFTRKPDPTPRRLDIGPFRPELCGTTSGYRQHMKFRQQQCDRCRTAYSLHQREYRERKRGGG